MFSYVAITNDGANVHYLEWSLTNLNMFNEDRAKIELLVSALKDHGAVQMNFEEYALYKSLLAQVKKYNV